MNSLNIQCMTARTLLLVWAPLDSRNEKTGSVATKILQHCKKLGQVNAWYKYLMVKASSLCWKTFSYSENRNVATHLQDSCVCVCYKFNCTVYNTEISSGSPWMYMYILLSTNRSWCLLTIYSLARSLIHSFPLGQFITNKESQTHNHPLICLKSSRAHGKMEDNHRVCKRGLAKESCSIQCNAFMNECVWVLSMSVWP